MKEYSQCPRCFSPDLVIRQRYRNGEPNDWLVCHNCGQFIQKLDLFKKRLYVGKGIKLDFFPRPDVAQYKLYFTLGDWDENSPTSAYIGTYSTLEEADQIAQDIVKKILGREIYYLQKTYVSDSVIVTDFGSHSKFYMTVLQNGVTNINYQRQTPKSLKVSNKKLEKIDDLPVSELMWADLKYTKDINDEMYDLMEQIEDEYGYKSDDNVV